MEAVEQRGTLFQEPMGLPFITATQLSRSFNQVLKELENRKAVEIQRKGISTAVLLDTAYFKKMIDIVEAQNDYIEQLEDIAAIRKYQDTPKEDREIIPWREVFTEEDEKDNEFMSMSSEELFD